MAKKSMRVIGEYTMITAATFVVAAASIFFSDSERCIGGKYFRSGDAFGKCDTAADFSADLYFKCGASGGGLSFLSDASSASRRCIRH